MSSVIEEAVEQVSKGQPCVLATVVRTKGMTPQKASAKQLFLQDGSSVGTLGGGCVEGDIWFYSKEILRERSGPQFREYVLNEDVVAKDGLVCGGTMYFYVEPFYKDTPFLEMAREILQAYKSGPPVSLATVVCSGKERHKPGDRLLIRQDGSTIGSLGSEALNREIVRIGRKVAPFGKNEYVTRDDGVEIYIEGFTTPPTLVIMGGGHVGKAVYELAVDIGFDVVIVDDRPEFSNPERFPRAKATVVQAFDTALDDLSLGLNSFILIATRGHRFDDMATLSAVATPARYVGLLGSKRKNLMIFRDLFEQGIPMERIQEIHAPVGLDIGALTPGELAVSIMAEMIMQLRGGGGGSMKPDSNNLIEQIRKTPKTRKKPLPF